MPTVIAPRHPPFSRLLAGLLSFLIMPLTGCTAGYFRAAEGPLPMVQYTTEHWPYREYWSGIIFSGDKIGFSHFAIEQDRGTLTVRSEAAMRLRFLTIDKRFTMTADEQLEADLSLKRFDYSYNLDGNIIHIRGHVEGETLVTTVTNVDNIEKQRHSLTGKVYSTSAVVLYPLIHGMEVGRSYRYPVYDGETRTVSEVEQTVLAYESSELFSGDAFKIRTTLHGHSVDTWINEAGLPVFEMSMGGVFISALESKQEAQRYLTQAALNKAETLLDFSRVPTDRPIENPRSTTALVVKLHGLEHFTFPHDTGFQRCQQQDNAMLCYLTSQLEGAGDDKPGQPSRYLASTIAVPAGHPRIQKKAQDIVQNIIDPEAQAVALIAWLGAHIEQQPVDVFSALDVLEGGKAECQGHSYLYAALARSLGIPTRVVNGLVYSEAGEGFFYHTWNESWINGRWWRIDSTFGQTTADATHIKLVEGERLDELTSLLPLFGRLRAEILDIDW